MEFFCQMFYIAFIQMAKCRRYYTIRRYTTINYQGKVHNKCTKKIRWAIK